MVVYLKDHKGRLKTIKEIAADHKVPEKLVYGRYQQGIRDINILIKEKFYMWEEKRK